MLVYVFLANNFEEIEAVTVIDILRRAEVEVCTVSITGSLFVVGSHGIEIKADALFDDVNFEEGKALVLPGGPGTSNYTKHSALLNVVNNYYANGKLVAAICAAPTILAGLGILDGKQATCYNTKAFPPSVTVAEQHTVKDCNIITSKAAATAPHFAFELVKAIKGEETARTISEKMYYHII